MARLIWFKDSLIPSSDAKIPLLSPSAQFGISVFEGIRAYWDPTQAQIYIFRLFDHIARLKDSCKLACIPYDINDKHLEDIIFRTITANEYKEDVALRIIIFLDEEGSWSSFSPSQLAVAPIPKRRHNLNDLPTLSACFSSWTRINDSSMPPRVKLGANYANGRYAHFFARKSGFDIPFFMDIHGFVSETPGSCIFFVKNGVLCTPSLSSSVLESITRSTILDLAKSMNIDIYISSFEKTELYLADEIFVCGSAAEITPVTSIDHYIINDRQPGPITTALLSTYYNVVTSRVIIDSSWTIPVYD